MEESKTMAVELGESAAEELKEPTSPDIHALFCHYNALYFHHALGACVLSWSSAPPMNRCTSICDYHPEGGCEIRLSEPLLKVRSTADLKNTLLHEMIHAFLWIKDENGDHSDHGASFQHLMSAINSSFVVDHQKPFGGYNITIYHDFRKEADSNEVYHWICGSCGDSIERTMDKGPSVSDCLDNIGQDESCSNPSCQWHMHKKLCSGSYTKKAESSGYKDEGMSSKGEQEPQKDKFQGLHYSRTTRRSSKTEGTKENSGGEKAITIANLIPSEGEVKRNSGSNSSGEGCEKDVRPEDNEKAIVLRDQDHVVALEMPKRARAAVPKKQHTSISRKKRKYGKVQNDFNVIIEWLGVYADEEDEEDVEPLINKRTERRKKQKLLRNLRVRTPEIDGMDDVPLLLEEKIKEDGVGNSVSCQPAHDQDPLPSDVSCGHRDAKSRYEGAAPLNSPVRDDVVDISDG